MRKVFLMLSVSLFSLNAEAACSPTPDCASLGYKYSLEECGGVAIKCPNGDSYYCTSPLAKCNLADIYYSDKTCSSADNYDITKTVLGVVVYITDGGLHGQIMAPWWVNTSGNSSSSVGMVWGGYGTDIPSLPNYTSSSSAEADYDSCGNTDKIVAAGSASTYPAAWATRKYAPTPETKGKWCLPAAGILRNIQNNQTAINTALNKVGGASNMLNYWVWSSSEYSGSSAWGASLNSSGLNYGTKSTSYGYGYVVPVLAF